jgi:hypothetical protein
MVKRLQLLFSAFSQSASEAARLENALAFPID